MRKSLYLFNILNKHYIEMQQEQHKKKIQRIVLELNKTGLSYLEKNQIANAYEYFKQAEKILSTESQIDQESQQLHRYKAVTFNNLAIYYKRTNKPKAALTYLKKAIQIETYKMRDWQATASTHLNICAIYSFMNKHLQAIEHAQLAIDLVQKTADEPNKQQKNNKNHKNNNNNDSDAINKIRLPSYYNLAVEYEHIQKYQQSLEAYKKTRDIAVSRGAVPVQTTCDQSIKRVEGIISKNKKKMIEMLLKKKQAEQKGNYSSMRRNKKNYRSKIIQDSHAEKTTQDNPKFEIYESKKPAQSMQKLQKIKNTKNLGMSKTRDVHYQSNDGLKNKKYQPIRTNRIESTNK